MTHLLAVCDVLVLKALETMGKWIVRTDRSRFRIFGDRPWYIAHTVWQPDDATVDKALKGAWDLVPVVVDDDPENIQQVLDQYVHDLVITGTPHTRDELMYRLARLGADDGVLV